MSMRSSQLWDLEKNLGNMFWIFSDFSEGKPNIQIESLYQKPLYHVIVEVIASSHSKLKFYTR